MSLIKKDINSKVGKSLHDAIESLMAYKEDLLAGKVKFPSMSPTDLKKLSKQEIAKVDRMIKSLSVAQEISSTDGFDKQAKNLLSK